MMFQVREMWFADGEEPRGPFSATLGLRRSSARVVNWGNVIGWRAQFLRNGLLGHDQGKSIYRLPLVSGVIGSHGPLSGALADRSVILPLDPGALLHFDSGSVPIWNEKWGLRLQGETVAVRVGRQRQAQEQLFGHALRQPAEKQEEFFRAFYSLDGDTQIRLQDAGVLTRVDVSEQLTSPLVIADASTSAREMRRLPPIADRVDFQFALVCDQRFVKPTFATMVSVLSHMGELGHVRFVILADGLERHDVVRLTSLEHTRYDVQVVVHDITTDLDRDVGTEDPKRATFGRIYLVDYLPEQRTIYLDGDVLATRPFPELFELDLGTAALAGVTDSAALRMVAEPSGVPLQQRNRLIGITDGDPLEYLNGGVLIFDLDNPDFWDLALCARALVVLQGHTLQQRDQDALNLAFAGRKHRLPSTYNYMTQFYVSERTLGGDLIQRKYENADATLVHFSGKVKPWVNQNDEFYNGLYRRLVSAAEEKVGVSCEFYFSPPLTPAPREWTVEQWVDTLCRSTRPATPDVTPADITLVEMCDEGIYLTLSPGMYELARTTDLRLAAFLEGRTLFEVPLADVSAQQAHLTERVAFGVRLLPIDLAAALAVCGGVARNVELAVTGPGPDLPGGYLRSLGVLDSLAAGPVATRELLADVGVDGALESLREGWLTGWVRPRSPSRAEAAALFIDGELAARRMLPAAATGWRRPEDTRPFKFFAANLVRLGYGKGREISVRLSGTNIPLRGGVLSVNDVRRTLRYDAGSDTWVEPPARQRIAARAITMRRSAVHRLRARLQKPS